MPPFGRYVLCYRRYLGQRIVHLGDDPAADRFLATRLGTACADLVAKRKFGVMVAAHGEGTRPVPLEDVVGKRKTVPQDHPWVAAARAVGTCLGD